MGVRSMQQFLMHLTSVEAALQSWRERLEGVSKGGETIDQEGLQAALSSLGVQCPAQGGVAEAYRACAFAEGEEGREGVPLLAVLQCMAVWTLIEVRRPSRLHKGSEHHIDTYYSYIHMDEVP